MPGEVLEDYNCSEDDGRKTRIRVENPVTAPAENPAWLAQQCDRLYIYYTVYRYTGLARRFDRPIQRIYTYIGRLGAEAL